MDYIEIIGFAAATCTTLSFLPQTIKTLKTKNTKDLSLSMYLLFVIGVAFWTAYGFLLNSLPIILANVITLILASTILVMKLKHK